MEGHAEIGNLKSVEAGFTTGGFDLARGQTAFGCPGGHVDNLGWDFAGFNLTRNTLDGGNWPFTFFKVTKEYRRYVPGKTLFDPLQPGYW